jgi:E1A/CREB-binding protein
MQLRKNRRPPNRYVPRPDELIPKFLDILKRLQDHEHGWVFSIPIDPTALELDDYFNVTKKPMDLSTIKQNCYAKVYHTFDDFRSDVLLTFDNAIKYCKRNVCDLSNCCGVEEEVRR